MLKRIFSRTFLLAVLVSAGSLAHAQSGEYLSYTPYSIFGIGDLAQQGSAYNRSMGGVGVASRNVRYLNSLNPAAVTARDSLSFLLDFSVVNSNTLYKQGGSSSAKNITNLGSMAVSFPIWGTTAVMLGISPYSSCGYSYKVKETDPAVLAANGNITYYDYGQGNLYRLYGGLGHAITKSLSVGAEVDYIFGNTGKYFTETFSKSGVNTVEDFYKMTLHAFTGKFGAQYEQKLWGDTKLGLGATYTLGTNLRGMVDYTHNSVGSVETVTVSSSSDTLSNNLGQVRLAGELALGVSLNFDERLRVELDYARADWSKTGMGTVDGFAVTNSTLPFSANVRQSFRAGMEFTPDRYNIRYYSRRISYRAGAYYNNEYYKVAGSEINNFGITLGATLPVFRWYNGLSIAVDLGQRGTTDSSLIRERYARISVGLNLHDIWFQKRRYE
ncbi:MAG: hypothetical protein K6F21_04895 [Bacteroidales bacterium]|nr:hypothetical protein [Bacteroidales bacterium]